MSRLQFKSLDLMPFKTLFLSTGLFCCVLTIASAQSIAATATSMPVTWTEAALDAEASEAFYRDADNQLVFIDFEQLNVNLQQVVLRSRGGMVLFQEDVFGLPVDAIYELDLSDYGVGTYRIELHTYTDVIEYMLQVE